MSGVQERLGEANKHITKAISFASSLTERDFEDEISSEYQQVAWCAPVILRNISAAIATAKQADTKADCADGVRDAHEWAFKKTTGLKATVEGFSDETIVSDDWHTAAEHFAKAQSIIDEEYERIENLGW